MTPPPAEILDRIYAYVATCSSKTETVETLKRAALVCQSWMIPAQRRLHAHVRMSTQSDLQNFKKRLACSSWTVGYMRTLEVELYNRGLALENQLTAAHLSEHASSFSGLVQLRITTHRTADDPDLAKMLQACLSLQALLIRHRWGNHTAAFEPYDTYHPFFDYSREDPTADPSGSVGGYRVDTLSDITSIVCDALPLLRDLRHLLLVRTTWNSLPTPLPNFDLKVLLLARSKSNIEFLLWLLQNSSSLDNFSLQFPLDIDKTEILQILEQYGSHLSNLCFDIPWVPRELPELMPWHSSPTSLLAGLSNDIVPLCPQLSVLRFHDPLLKFEVLSQLQDLRDVRVSMHAWKDFVSESGKSLVASVRRLEMNIPDCQLSPCWSDSYAWMRSQEQLHGLELSLNSCFMHYEFVSYRIEEILVSLPA